VYLDPVLYEQEGLRQLENTHYYSKIFSPLANDVADLCYCQRAT